MSYRQLTTYIRPMLWVLALLTALPSSLLAAGPNGAQLKALKNHPYHGYELILHIDKAKQGTSMHAQRIRVYRYDESTESVEFIARWRISSGAEVAAENEVGRITPRTTLLGYYNVEVLNDVAYSNSWDGLMLYSMFYDNPRYAIHATDPNKYVKLGRRASGGCTRLEQNQARKIYMMIQDMGKGWTYKLNRKTGKPVTPQWSYKAMVVIEEHSQLEVTRFGLMDKDEVYSGTHPYDYYLSSDYAVKASAGKSAGSDTAQASLN